MRRVLFVLGILLVLSAASSNAQSFIWDPSVRGGGAFGLGVTANESGPPASATRYARTYRGRVRAFAVSLPVGELGVSLSAQQFTFDSEDFTVRERALLFGPVYRMALFQHVEWGLAVQGGALRRRSVSERVGSDYVRSFGRGELEGYAGIRYDRFFFSIGIGRGAQTGRPVQYCPTGPVGCRSEPPVQILDYYTSLSLGVSYTILD